MNATRAADLLYDFISDTELHHPENWDDSEDTNEWRQNAIDAIESVVSFLNTEEDSIGTLILNGEKYILKNANLANEFVKFDFKNAKKIFKDLIEDVGLHDEEQWVSKGFSTLWTSQNIEAIHFVNDLLSSFSEECVGQIDLNDEKMLVFKSQTA